MQSFKIEPGPHGLPDIENPIVGVVMYVKPFSFVPKKRKES